MRRATPPSDPNWDGCYLSRLANGYNANIPLQVFPNPSDGVYNVVTRFTQPQNLTLTVYDVNGRVVYTLRQPRVTDYFGAIDLTSMTSGVYVLKVETSEGFNTLRIIKQ